MNQSPEDLIAQMLGVREVTTRPIAGGTWSKVLLVESVGSRPVVAKIGPAEITREEWGGLQALRETHTVRIPQLIGREIGDSIGILLIEFLAPGTDPDWDRFARDLAGLHQADVGSRYGFALDNHLGATVQRNTWCDDWAEFNRCFRHGPLVHSAAFDPEDRRLVQSAIDAFPKILGQPRPSLIHGDLWSGNAIPLADRSVALIDPAPSCGDPLADIAMMQLFGGFPASFFDAYFQASGLDPHEQKLAAYRLYHALNHLHLFGKGYLGMVLREARLILDES